MQNKNFYNRLRLMQEPRFMTPFERKVWQSQRPDYRMSETQSALIGIVCAIVFFVGCLWLSM